MIAFGFNRVWHQVIRSFVSISQPDCAYGKHITVNQAAKDSFVTVERLMNTVGSFSHQHMQIEEKLSETSANATDQRNEIQSPKSVHGK